jgi:hypothetical protein
MRLEEVFLNDLAQSNLVDMDRPPMRIDITGVGQPTAPEEVGPAPDDLTAMATQMAAGTEPEGATPMSLAEFATSAADVPAGLLKGAVQGSIGLPGDIISLARGLYDLGASGGDLDAFLAGLEKPTGLPTTEDMKKFFDETLGVPLIPEGADQRRAQAAKIPEFVGELGGGGKTAIEGTKAAVRGINVGSMAVADRAVQAIMRDPNATAMGALEAAGQMSPVSRIAPGVKAQAVQPIKDDSRLLMPAFLDKTKKMESGLIKLNSPIKMKDGSTLSGFESADQKVFYGRDKNGVAFNVPREYVNPDDFVSSRDGNKTMEKIKANLVESRSQGLTLDVAPSVRTKNFKNWFGDSKVVDSKGKPLIVYHGTGNLESMKSFDPALTGQGLDQLGSGFYFTTNAEEASGYSTRVTQQAGPGAKKLGGDSSPGVVAAYLSIKNPLKVKGSSLRDANIDISSDQAFEILKNSPDIKNMENTPLWNWIDLSGSDEIRDDMIMDVAQNYTGSSLISLENDFFRDGATNFRAAIRDVLGYDGVVMEFENGTKHFVAWFPEQIKSAVGNIGTFDPRNPDIAKGVVPTAGAAAGAAAMQDNEERM